MARTSRTKCSSCGRVMPRTKLVPSYRKVFGDVRKQYLCIVCAKRRGIPVQKSRQKIIHSRGASQRRRARRRREY